MAIVEILRGEFIAGNMLNPGAITNYSSWVVDNTVNEVVCDMAAVPFVWTFSSVTGQYKLSEKDNITVLSMWVCLPYHFALSDTSLNAIMYHGNAGAVGPIPEFSPPLGRVAVPVVNTEISLGIFVPWRGAAGAFMSFGCQFINPIISQIGVPASLNGTRLYPRPFVKIMHNLPLTS